MKPKRLLAILMSLAMVAGLAACGNSEGSAGGNSGSAAGTEAAGDTAAADDSAAGDAAADDGDLEDIAQIDIMFWTLNTIPSDTDLVEEAINEITREKINTEVNLNIMEMGNYVQQMNLIISGGEKMDLMVTPVSHTHLTLPTNSLV